MLVLRHAWSPFEPARRSGPSGPEARHPLNSDHAYTENRTDPGQVPDPTTLGRFLASFNLGHIRPFDRALNELFALVHRFSSGRRWRLISTRRRSSTTA